MLRRARDAAPARRTISLHSGFYVLYWPPLARPVTVTDVATFMSPMFR